MEFTFKHVMIELQVLLVMFGSNIDIVNLLMLQKLRILHECLCFIELIKRVGESNKMWGLLSILSLFRKNSIIQKQEC